MPNHVKNRITIEAKPDLVETIVNELSTTHEATLFTSGDGKILCKKKSENGNIYYGWFCPKTGVFIKEGVNKEKSDVIGLPDSWEFVIRQQTVCFPDFNKIIPQPESNSNCYDWNINNWGTKWNSYEHEKLNYNTYQFETAWQAVPKLILEISKKYPEATIKYVYADEDIGYNCGKCVFTKGELVKQIIPEGGSKQAYDLAFSLRPEAKKDYQLINGKYE